MDSYTTLPWAALCEEAAKLRVELREGRLLEFPRVAAVGCDSPCDSPSDGSKKLIFFKRLSAYSVMGEEGLEPSPTRISRDQQARNSGRFCS